MNRVCLSIWNGRSNGEVSGDGVDALVWIFVDSIVRVCTGDEAVGVCGPPNPLCMSMRDDYSLFP